MTTARSVSKSDAVPVSELSPPGVRLDFLQLSKSDAVSTAELSPPGIGGLSLPDLTVNLLDSVGASDSTAVVIRFTAFADARAAIVAGLTSAQNEADGWNVRVKAALNSDLAKVVRTDDQTVTITLPATSSYNITSNETITVTIPVSALQASTSQIVASPTFDVRDDKEVSVSDQSSVAETVARQVVGNLSVSDAASVADTTSRQVVGFVSASDAVSLAESTSAQPEAEQELQVSAYDSVPVSETASSKLEPLLSSVFDSVSSAESLSQKLEPLVSSVSDSVSAADSTTESIGNLLASVSDAPSVADQPSARLDVLLVSLQDATAGAELTAEALNFLFSSTSDAVAATEYRNENVVSSGTVTVNVSDAVSATESTTNVARYTTFADARGAIVLGLISAQSETHGWNNDVIAALQSDLSKVVRTDDQTVTITIPATAAYSITSDETITVHVPASALQASTSEIVATPTFDVRDNKEVSLSDATAVSEYRYETIEGVTPGVNVNLYDAVALAESISKAFNLLVINRSDEVSVADDSIMWGEWSETGEFTTQKIDTVSISESATAQLQGGDRSVAESDQVSLSESTAARLDKLVAILTDAVSVAETASATVASVSVSESDSAAVAEYVSTRLDILNVSVYDAISAAENLQQVLSGARTLSCGDTAGVSEYVSAQLNKLNVNVSDAAACLEQLSAFTDPLFVAESDAVSASEYLLGAVVDTIITFSCQDSVLAVDPPTAGVDGQMPYVDRYILRKGDSSLTLDQAPSGYVSQGPDLGFTSSE